MWEQELREATGHSRQSSCHCGCCLAGTSLFFRGECTFVREYRVAVGGGAGSILPQDPWAPDRGTQPPNLQAHRPSSGLSYLNCAPEGMASSARGSRAILVMEALACPASSWKE